MSYRHGQSLVSNLDWDSLQKTMPFCSRCHYSLIACCVCNWRFHWKVIIASWPNVAHTPHTNTIVHDKCDPSGCHKWKVSGKLQTSTSPNTLVFLETSYEVMLFWQIGDLMWQIVWPFKVQVSTYQPSLKSVSSWVLVKLRRQKYILPMLQYM